MKPLGEFDSLEFRYKAYMECARREFEFPDEGLPKMVLAEYATRSNLENEQRILLAYLYGMCYNPLTTIFLFEQYPFGSAKQEEWWQENKQILDFQQDKAKIKYMNKLVPSVESLQQNWQNLFNAVFTQDFDSVRKVVKGIKFFGSHATYLMYDILEAMYGEKLPSLPKVINWNEHRLPAEGMLHLLGYDEMVPLTHKKLPADTLSLLDTALESLLASTKIGLLETESVLCAYRKLFKQTRYSGYYRDRHLENINSAKVSQHIIKFNLEVRKNLLPEELLGEYSGWEGIRKEKCKEFVFYGTI